MTDTPADTAPSGIAVLAEDEPSWEDGPFPVRGVALPEDITTNGSNTEGVSTYWPPDVVAEAAAMFDGAKIVDGSEHTAEQAMERPQPSPESIIGEITGVQYRPGVGVLYEGEVDDPDIAKRIDRGRVEVSPTVFRTLGEEVDDDVVAAGAVKAVRDLSIVAEGAAEGNSIEPATAMTALTAEALSAAFDEGTEDTTTGADSPTDADGSGDDGPDDEAGQSTADRTTTETMSDEDTLTDDQRELLAAADRLDDPTVVESEHAEVLEAAAGCEEPHVVEQTDYEALQDDLTEAKGVLADALSERTGMDAEKIAENFTWEALREEFEDDDGKLSAEALVQEPETGDTDGTEDNTEEIEALLEERGFDDREAAVESLQNQYENLSQAGWETQAEGVKADLETLGVEV